MKTRFVAAVSLLVPAVAVVVAGAASTSTINVAAGVVEVAADGQCSLIEGLENANGKVTHTDCTAGEDGADTVNLAPGSVYILTEVHHVDHDGASGAGPNGLPNITTPIYVKGHGSTIARSSQAGTPEFRLLNVNETGDLTIEGLMLRNGRLPESFYDGGGIANAGTLAVIRSVLVNNFDTAVAVDFVSGTTTINESVIRDSPESAVSTGDTITITSSTIHDNAGHGIFCIDGTLTVINSTLSGNSGDGINSEGCMMTLANSTVRGNHRGLWVQKQPTVLTNTIIADSLETDCSLDKAMIDFNGVNLLEDGSCGCIGPSCISGDPSVGELADNGGPVPTHALLAGSLAIDKAGDAECPDEDQRGVLRALDAAGDGSDEDLDGGCDIGAFEAGGFVARGLAVDPESLASNGNGVFEPGEDVIAAPAWQNAAIDSFTLGGTASAFSGPDGPSYELVVEDAEYGQIGAGVIASCLETGACYEMAIDLESGERPSTHWDATFEETLSDGLSKTWTLHLGDSFVDVPRVSPYYPFIEAVLHRGVTAGCGSEEYCPTDTVTRAAMAPFALKAHQGAGYRPRPCEQDEEIFVDVPFDSPFCAWIERLARGGVVSGCGRDPLRYCPTAPVSRAQIAVVLLRTLLGSPYEPPECVGIFDDVPCSSPFARWVEDLYAREISSACGTNPLRYCPSASITRSLASVFLTKTYGLTLYGP